eukprot:7380124-Prymnesium_polylepis.2
MALDEPLHGNIGRENTGSMQSRKANGSGAFAIPHASAHDTQQAPRKAIPERQAVSAIDGHQPLQTAQHAGGLPFQMGTRSGKQAAPNPGGAWRTGCLH